MPAASAPPAACAAGFASLAAHAASIHYRLEKLGFLDTAESWHTLRAIRNRFAHDYPEDDALKAAYLNEAVESVPLLQAILGRVQPLVAQAQAAAN